MTISRNLTMWGIAVLAAPGCTIDDEPEPLSVRPVRTVVAERVDAARQLRFSGMARAAIESRLSFRVPGTVHEIAANVGDAVETGDIIARLESTDYELAVKNAEASSDSARAQLASASANFDRISALWEADNASQSEYDQADAARRSARAAFDSAGKQLELAQRNLEYTSLRAPRGGRIADVPVEVNENVSAGQTVAVLTAGALPEVEVAVPEGFIGRIRTGQSCSVLFDVSGVEPYPGVVLEVGVARIRSASYAVRVQVLERRNGTQIFPGMAAEVLFTVESDDPRPRFLLPSSAVAADEEGPFVFVVVGADELGEEGSVARRPVETGDLTTEGLEVFSGIEPGDRVVTAGVHLLGPGMAVRL